MSGLCDGSDVRIAHSRAIVLLIALFCPVLAAEDNELDVDPVMTYFGAVDLGDSSAPAQVVFTNKSSTHELEIHGQAQLIGSNADQFSIVNDGCATKTLAAGNPGEYCSVWVAFSPSRYRSKMAMLSLTVNDGEAKKIVAFLSSQEDVPTEVKRRLPPILYDLDMPVLLDAQVPAQSVSWSVLGYHQAYLATLALFDCTNVSQGSCGDDFDDNFWSVSELYADSISNESAWNYRGEVSKVFHYSARISGDDLASLSAGFSDVVARFYIKSLDDQAAEASSTSLLVPGGLGIDYYGTEGRKLLLQAVK